MSLTMTKTVSPTYFSLPGLVAWLLLPLVFVSLPLSAYAPNVLDNVYPEAAMKFLRPQQVRFYIPSMMIV